MKFLRFYWYIAVAFIYLFIILSLYRSYHRVNLKKWSQMVILLFYLSRTKILFEEAIFFFFWWIKNKNFHTTATPKIWDDDEFISGDQGGPILSSKISVSLEILRWNNWGAQGLKFSQIPAGMWPLQWIWYCIKQEKFKISDAAFILIKRLLVQEKFKICFR